MRKLSWWKSLERATRPVHPVTERVLAERWAALPAGVRTDQQILGRHAVGCEGTHGVFPKCNLTCSPCYHSKDANKVRVDGAHTVAQVEAQMSLLEAKRGPRAHAQLIGGEVSLLDPEDHAAALAAMRRHGREPMSMSHGDFGSDYLRALALDEKGRPRFGRLSFAAHFDSLMRGRTGIPRPRTEVELNPFRARFVEMFRDLRRDHGVRSYLAHTMTITPANLDQVSEVVGEVSRMGFSMLSFQPAAHVGDERRWTGGDYRTVGIDDVWDQLEVGLGQRVAWQALQVGDPRCNRTGFGIRVDERWVPMFDPDSEGDLAARDRALAHFGGVNFGGTTPLVLAVKVLRVLARHPGDVTVAVAWVRRLVERSGGGRRVWSSLRRGVVTPMTYVVHNFMDAADVAPAWRLMQADLVASDPAVRATQERLSACAYAMAHPETGELVPACVQHSVLDPGENEQLRRLLPLTVVEPPGPAKSQTSAQPAQPVAGDEHSLTSGFDLRLR
ncbi:radical SAM domain-containing protein [Nocardioides sp. InS609-2]|uniref:radical SAM domain-containing protein n=1 Tax=Nocardioides sp. InS609-2 TaxID=2760705 RepID=UPI0020BD5780|nr:radical SAM domain-containing protein [Nocardioides sp. InS609-2]